MKPPLYTPHWRALTMLYAALAESHPGTVEPTVEKIPRCARKYLKTAIESARRYIEQTHPRAWEELRPG